MAPQLTKNKGNESNGFHHSNHTKVNCDTKILSKFQRAFICKSKWPEKEDFLDVVYWLRQFIGVFLGIFWGVIPLKGFFGIFLFCILSVVMIFVYISSFQGIDEEEYGGIWELLKEGFMTSFAGFLVTWILLYSWIHAN